MLSNSKLGFGLMRLPKDESGSIDLSQAQTMVDHFMNSGFTYFDTAYAYAGSENAIRETLVKKYPRTSFTLADKLPAWKLKNEEDVKRIFNESLEAAGVDYFDFYLLHSVEEKHLPTYEKLGTFEFLKEMKAQRKIRHIGFSYHDGPELLEKTLTDHLELEFVQLQLNYLDWENGVIQSRSNYEVAKKFDKPIIVMEPIKGGTLASLPPESEKIRQQNIAQTSAPALALRFLAEKDGIMTILSADTIPCTKCRYCVPGCPMHISIPDLFTAWNSEQLYGKNARYQTYYEKYANASNPASACIACGRFLRYDEDKERGMIMKLHYKGKYNLDPETLPAALHKEGAVQFKEAGSTRELGKQANIIAVVLLILLFIPIGFLRLIDLDGFGFWIGILLSLVCAVPHEIIHALCFREDVYLYTNLKQSMLFVIGTEPMSKARFVFMSVLPSLVFGLIPYLIGLFIPHCAILLGLGWSSISMGAGDYINIYHALTQMPKGAKTYMSGFHSWWYMPEENGE